MSRSRGWTLLVYNDRCMVLAWEFFYFCSALVLTRKRTGVSWSHGLVDLMWKACICMAALLFKPFPLIGVLWTDVVRSAFTVSFM